MRGSAANLEPGDSRRQSGASSNRRPSTGTCRTPFFDGILDEECNQYSECATLTPYVTADKPAWDAEYKEDGASTAAFCASDIKGNIVGALFALDLDGSLFEPCPNDVGMIH